MSQDILPVDLCGLSYAAQMETTVIGSMPGSVTIAAEMQPGWLIYEITRYGPQRWVTGFNHSMVALSDILATAVREIALSSPSRNGSGSTSILSATSSGGAPASCRSATSIPE